VEEAMGFVSGTGCFEITERVKTVFSFGVTQRLRGINIISFVVVFLFSLLHRYLKVYINWTSI